MKVLTFNDMIYSVRNASPSIFLMEAVIQYLYSQLKEKKKIQNPKSTVFYLNKIYQLTVKV